MTVRLIQPVTAPQDAEVNALLSNKTEILSTESSSFPTVKVPEILNVNLSVVGGGAVDESCLQFTKIRSNKMKARYVRIMEQIVS